MPVNQPSPQPSPTGRGGKLLQFINDFYPELALSINRKLPESMFGQLFGS
ncbi:hypothetical protein [Alysiella filiformis]|nr:hypothetical protein [Alysiella filiformis]